MLVDVQAVRKVPLISLAQMRERPELEDMLVLKRGNRLSITPVEPRHWKAVEKLLSRNG
jgi:predicted RNA-binding protein with PUA-like domain